jgi:hypothetical protein
VKINNITNNKMNNNLENINDKFIKIINYYNNLYSLLISYLQELTKHFESTSLSDELKNKITSNNYLVYIKKIKISNEDISNDELYILYNYIKLSNDEINKLIYLVQNYNIYNEKTLLSDTSKMNINQNKINILDMYNKITNKFINFDNIYLNYIQIKFIYNLDNYNKLYNYFIKNLKILDLYLTIIKQYLLNDSIHFKNLIIYNNCKIKELLLNNELIKLKYNFNTNKNNDINYLFKSNIQKVTINNIITKFNQFIVYKSFNNLKDLFTKISDSEYKFKNNNIDSSNLKLILQIINNLYKIDKKYINITILESNYDNINYNCANLINQNFILEKNQGIDDNYINKTKTIFTKEEIINNLNDNDNQLNYDIYLSNIKNIYNINNFNNTKIKVDNDKINILLSTHFILIYKLDNKFYLMQCTNSSSSILQSLNIYTNNYIIEFQNILPILLNKPNYMIENSNLLIENSILNNINKNNMLELYKKNIENDFKNLPKVDNLELKNILINKIKKSIQIDNNFIKNKTNNIDIIINIIIDEIYIYIQRINNINYTSEIYMTYFSNINSLINKIKKELNDNYDTNILINIDNILDNIYNNILTINNNLLDKYYLINLN